MKTLRNMFILMAAVLAAGAIAQTSNGLWELNRTFRGDGVEKVNEKKNREYSSVVVNLRNDGTAYLKFVGDRSTDFNGKWRGPYNNIVTVTVHERDAEGSFRVFLEDREVRRVEGTVRRKDDRINILFKCDIVRGPDRPSIGDRDRDNNRDRDSDNRSSNRDFENLFGSRLGNAVLDSGGKGSLRRGRDDWDVKRAKVEIKRDGNIMIQIKGDKNETFRGKWRRDGDGRISFTITDAFGDKRAKGSGMLTFRDKDEVDYVRMNVRAKDSDYSLTFNRK